MINTELDLSTAIKEIGNLTQDKIKLKEDIENLVGVLENLNSVVDHYWNNGRTDAQVNAITSVQQKCQKILIKHKQS